MNRRGAVILCGGKSSRMGRPKALLPFGDELLLQRMVRIVRQVVERVVVVSAAEQTLPELPGDVSVTQDRRPERGPLEGMAAGLEAIGPHVDAAYITSCDVPLLLPAFVDELFGRLESYDAVVPVEDKFHHPLAAVYRPRVAPVIQRLLAHDRFRPVFIFDEVPTQKVPVDQLRGVDPELQSLRNVNSPEDYAEALRLAGL
jgi:molybdenum cofactor guanylyltransferase